MTGHKLLPVRVLLRYTIIHTKRKHSQKHRSKRVEAALRREKLRLQEKSTFGTMFTWNHQLHEDRRKVRGGGSVQLQMLDTSQEREGSGCS